MNWVSCRYLEQPYSISPIRTYGYLSGSSDLSSRFPMAKCRDAEAPASDSSWMRASGLAFYSWLWGSLFLRRDWINPVMKDRRISDLQYDRSEWSNGHSRQSITHNVIVVLLIVWSLKNVTRLSIKQFMSTYHHDRMTNNYFYVHINNRYLQQQAFNHQSFSCYTYLHWAIIVHTRSLAFKCAQLSAHVKGPHFSSL